MSYYDDASLMLLASGGAQKDGKVYSVKPTDGSGDFTFTRGSNLSATRVDASQLIEKGRENVLLQSNSFDTTWTNANTTETGGQAGYNGTNYAWLLSGSGQYPRIQQSVSSSGVNTISVYAKANTNNYLFINMIVNATGAYACFDLVNQTETLDLATKISSNITDIGNGWCRVSLAFSGTLGLVNFGMSNDGTVNGWINFTSGSIYIQDSQVELGLVATPYIETGASTAQAGILEDTPRFDYSGGASCPSLLLEPQRSNLVTQSEYMVNFIKGSATGLTANTGNSPEGLNNATYFYCSATTTNGYINQGWVGTSGVQYSVSFYAKAKELNLIYIKNVNDSGAQSYFDLSNGTFTLLSGLDSMSIKDVGDGWYRCTAISTSTSTYIQWIPILKGNANEGVYVYGLQIEQGSYPTSYIPTYGVSQTRAQDICINLSLTTSTDFTIFFEAKDFSLINGSTGGSYDNVQFVFSGDGAPYSANGSFHIYNNTLYYYSGSTAQGFGLIYNNQTDSKFVIMKRGDKVLAFANGSKITEATLPSGADAKVINWDAINLTSSLQDGQGDVFGSKYQQLLKFDTALSDLDAEILTGATTYNTFAAMALALNYTVYE